MFTNPFRGFCVRLQNSFCGFCVGEKVHSVAPRRDPTSPFARLVLPRCDPTLFWRIVGYFGLLSENPGGDVGEDFGGDCLLYFAVVEAFFGIGTLLEHVVHAWVFLGGDRF